MWTSPAPQQDLHLVVLLHLYPRLGKQHDLGLALYQTMVSRGRTQTPRHTRTTHLTDLFIPGEHSEQGEEAELPGRQQWLLLRVHPPATTGVWGKQTACLPLQGRGRALTHCQAGATPLPQKKGRGME